MPLCAYEAFPSIGKASTIILGGTITNPKNGRLGLNSWLCELRFCLILALNPNTSLNFHAAENARLESFLFWCLNPSDFSIPHPGIKTS